MLEFNSEDSLFILWMQDKSMILRLLILGSVLLLNFEAFCQHRKTSFEIFLLCDFGLQSYSENDLIHSYPQIEKATSNTLDKTYGFGSQIAFELNSYLSFLIGLGFKYTGLDFWFSNPTSSSSEWYFFAKEEATLMHLFAPIGLYVPFSKNRKFRVVPGITIEPNMLIHNESTVTTRNSDLLSIISEPESSPRKLLGLYSLDLRFYYGFNNSNEIFTTIKLHNAPKYFSEDPGITSLPIGFMINIGYRFKSRHK